MDYLLEDRIDLLFERLQSLFDGLAVDLQRVFFIQKPLNLVFGLEHLLRLTLLFELQQETLLFGNVTALQPQLFELSFERVLLGAEQVFPLLVVRGLHLLELLIGLFFEEHEVGLEVEELLSQIRGISFNFSNQFLLQEFVEQMNPVQKALQNLVQLSNGLHFGLADALEEVLFLVQNALDFLVEKAFVFLGQLDSSFADRDSVSATVAERLEDCLRRDLEIQSVFRRLLVQGEFI